MIQVRLGQGGHVEELALDEFRQRCRSGHISPTHQIRFPAVTGDAFVPARELDAFRCLHASEAIAFKRYFHFGRVPWLTASVVAILSCSYFFWQGGAPPTTIDEMMQQGAKSRALMVELGQWWRLASANLLHVSGWHLLGNSFFLFNLGGIAEATYRRIDYLLILVASALGTNLLSTIASPAVSCGASGMVFGVWGAAAVFGLRYRRLLPARYRRVFFGNVLPYSVLALYIGFVTPGVDNWGHLGGLVCGSLTALCLPARLLAPRDPHAVVKLLSASLLAIILVGLGLFPAGPGDLTTLRYAPRGGLVTPVPSRWQQSVARSFATGESHAFENGAGVVVALATHLFDEPQSSEASLRHFIETDLAAQLEVKPVRGMRLHDSVDTVVAGHPAKHLRAEFLSNDKATRADYVLLARGYYRYVISLSAPMWLTKAYEPTFEAIRTGIRFTEPAELSDARAAAAHTDAPDVRTRLALALAHAGDPRDAERVLSEAIARWPNAGSLYAAQAELIANAGTDPERACDLMGRALLDKSYFTPSLVARGVRIFETCGRKKAANELTAEGHRRFGDDRAPSSHEPRTGAP